MRKGWHAARRRGRPAIRLLLLLALVLAVHGPIGSGSAAARPSHAGALTTQPNIVLILTDDQRWDTLWAMPNLQSELVAHGMTFANNFVVNSTCCPSRTTGLTGEYSHTTGVWTNSFPYGGFNVFHDTSTIATWLHNDGYRTGLIGKYLNQYRVKNGRYIPPGWDRWFALLQGKIDNESAYYYNYTVSDQGTNVVYGSTDADYSTDVFAGQADSFIRGTSSDQPLFLYFATAAPHAPATPPTRYANSFSGLAPYRPPNYNEADVTDKPAYIRGLKKLGATAQANVDAFRIKQYDTLLAVDDAINTIVTALSDTGRLSNTMIVFASDNGLTWAEHRWQEGKAVPYEESIRVPLVIRYDPLTTSPSTDTHLVANIDVAPTFAALAGVASPGVEGTSLLPLLSGSPVDWRTDFLIEHVQETDKAPTYCAVRTEGYIYVTYATGEEELYDLAADPYELANQASNAAYAGTVAALRTQLQQLCAPVPPGFLWPYDALAPSVPTGLTGSAASSTEVDLSWQPSTDNVGVTGYTVYRDGISIGTVAGSTTAFTDTTVTGDATYSYTVDAFDAAGNHSAQSDPFQVTTPP
jgi:N-acetylglucosamine-6-sulfatase